MNNYVIVNADRIKERIEELIKEANAGKTIPYINSYMAESLIKFRQELLSNSISLIPEIENAFNEARIQSKTNDYGTVGYQNAKDYVDQLKLNI